MATKFLINPISGTQAGQRVSKELHEACSELGYREGKDYTLEWTHPGRTTEQACRAAHMCDRVVAVGGDGTVRQVAEGLLKAGTGAALGVIPRGTGNDFSRALGLYELWRRRRGIGVRRVIQWLMTAPTSPVDVLTVNDYCYFVSYCSVGFDAQVSRAYERMRRHAKLGAVLRGRAINECAYALLALRHSRSRLPEVRVSLYTLANGWTETRFGGGIRAVIVSNIATYAGGAPLVEGSRYDDGQFEVTTIPRLWQFVLLIASRLWPQLRPACKLQSWTVERVRVGLPRECPVQVDGEDCTEGLTSCGELSIRVAGQIPAVLGPH